MRIGKGSTTTDRITNCKAHDPLRPIFEDSNISTNTRHHHCTTCGLGNLGINPSLGGMGMKGADPAKPFLCSPTTSVFSVSTYGRYPMHSRSTLKLHHPPRPLTAYPVAYLRRDQRSISISANESGTDSRMLKAPPRGSGDVRTLSPKTNDIHNSECSLLVGYQKTPSTPWCTK